MTRPLRAAVIGCGAVAANHAAAYHELPGVELVACADLDPARASALADRFGGRAVAADDLYDHAPDLVSVCTPHPAHEAAVLRAAAHGVHVLCEKPIANELDAARRMVRACDDAGVRLGVLFQRRFWPAARRIRTALDDGTLGRPLLADVAVLLHRDTDYYRADPWRSTRAGGGGGVLSTQAVHYLDLLQWYMGVPVEVSCTHATFAHGDATEAEDTSVATVRFAGGGLATLSASTALTPGLGCRIRVTGSTGATVGLSEYPEGSEAGLDVWAVPGAARAGTPYGQGLVADVGLARINGDLAPFHALQIAEFVTAVRDDRDPAVTGREATRSLALLTALHASAASGRPEPVPTVHEEIPA
ncbi:Gfo/Idh/MocA family protein [Pseudonocardia spirodelae]|uniref:Gfo/Idh/MocA family oxidoreductase n=1 Tax=Pseudonocardia spirodelae TaxID=3133431 RepID=A0ABU8T7G6_9PSEU